MMIKPPDEPVRFATLGGGVVTLTSHGKPHEPAMGRWVCDCGEESHTDHYGRIHHDANQHAATCRVLPPQQPTDGGR